ncbi:MAG: sugar ABC transporter permease [Candidatus Promineofilum sp.]|jgi:multiple sugar transport system permease protein|nr:sugar ABC transporter permease [Promineifilum sp.]
MAVATGTAEQVKQRRYQKRTGNQLVPYLFIAPHLIFFLIFVAYPFFYGLYISFFRFDFLRPEAQQFVLLDNYAKLFSPDSIQFPVFWNALGNTVKFVLYSVPPLIIIPLLLAVLLNTRVPGRNFFRGLYFSPWVLSAAVVGLLGFWIFQSQGGLVNFYLVRLGITPPRWLSTLPWAWVAIVAMTLWWTVGFNMIILLAALQDIPRQLYESASLDGATNWQQFVSITLPILRPVLVFVIIITIIASFNLFAQPFFMTNGGPAQATGGGSTEPVMLRIYREGFERNQLGMAAAMSFIVATIMIIFSYTNFRLFRTRE